MFRPNPKDFNSMRYLPQLRSRIRTYLRQKHHLRLLKQEQLSQVLIPELLKDEIIYPIVRDIISQQMNTLFKTNKHEKYMVNHQNEQIIKKIKQLFNQIIKCQYSRFKHNIKQIIIQDTNISTPNNPHNIISPIDEPQQRYSISNETENKTTHHLTSNIVYYFNSTCLRLTIYDPRCIQKKGQKIVKDIGVMCCQQENIKDPEDIEIIE